MKFKLLQLMVAMLIGFGVPAWAHHSFSAVFDADSPIEASGTVTRVDWRNPHAWTRNIGELEPLRPGDSYRSKWFLPGFFERRGNTKYGDVVIGPGNDVQAGWYAVVANA
jgi:hypothetical protein